MTAHTPGPWKVEPCTEGGAFEITEGIGSVGTAWGENDEALANARLMAAAPALLERLRAMVSGAECECDKTDPEHPLCDICWSRQVIARAEGVERRTVRLEVQIEVDAPAGADIDCDRIARRVQDEVFVSMHDRQDFNPDATVVRVRAAK